MKDSGRRWLFAIYLALLGLGSALSYYVYEQGREARGQALSLTRQDLAALSAIADLKGTVQAREPILYRYYADPDRAEFRRAYGENVRRMAAGMARIESAFAGAPDLGDLRREQQTLDALAERLDRVFGALPYDWDEARLVLADIATVSGRLNARLDQIALRVEQHVSARGEVVSQSVEKTFYAVAGVSALTFVLALFFGHYGWQHVLDARRQRLLALFPERNPNPVYRLASDGTIRFANPAARHMEEDLETRPGQPGGLLPRDLPARLSAMRERGQALAQFEYALGERVFSCTLQYLEDFDGFHAYLEDITARKAAERQNEFLAYHDPLTGLPNRRRFEDNATRLLHQAPPGAPFAVLLINVDRFRMVTQSLGHLAGDQLMCALSARLTEALDDVENGVHATLYRLEGDRFAALMDGADLALSARIGEHLRLALREAIEVEGRALLPTLSIGLACFPSHGADFTQLLKNAESAMRRVKEAGGDGVRLYDPEMNAHALEQLVLAQELRLAVVHNEMDVHYQPKVDLREGHIVGMEALVRWKHPVRGMVPPADFIPLAEETGSIVEIGDWTLRTACAQNRAWQQAGLPPVVVSVNVSTRQFNADLPRQVEHILETTGLDACWLELEITESVAMDRAESAVEIMERLRALGTKLAIDDFGTGFSSLAYLKRFPIQTLKIDQSFVRQMEKNPTDRAIAHGIVELGHSLGLEVIAEGVQELAHLALLREFGCDTMQGYLYSRPLAAGPFETLLGSGRRLAFPAKVDGARDPAPGAGQP